MKSRIYENWHKYIFVLVLEVFTDIFVIFLLKNSLKIFKSLQDKK